MGGNLQYWDQEFRLKTTMEEFHNALMNSTIKRFMFVRNPYSRLLSAYLDKVILQHKRGVYPHRFKESSGFPGFLHALRNENRRGVFTRFTYAPLSKLCEIPKGMKYDYYLKIEQMKYWYKPFINHLDMQAAVSLGWNVTTKWFHGGNQSCFYASPGQTCASMFDAGVFDADGGQGNKEDTLKEIKPKSFHATGSDSQLGYFYNAFLVGNLVKSFAKDDFNTFLYPFWNFDTESPNEYIRKVTQLFHEI
eukprot:CAMPEP_0204891496 /NCGR_PEP_ID=MMETSP1349-20130617/27376_1 /ASSEMBLY_ACC=CAM_ASM_000710 /TAXON_ID=215587 /ORGANISM="Aplanochytrium stocchinoi, Strain GSBS06" /LENGTH=248 /DNA_ID=CAMNT_0052056903 /DNA_START=228 /DNA_END=974 /DNA_ORIENTATION=+